MPTRGGVEFGHDGDDDALPLAAADVAPLSARAPDVSTRSNAGSDVAASEAAAADAAAVRASAPGPTSSAS